MEIKKIISISSIILGCIFLFLIFNPFVIINSEQKGLLFTFGKISDKILDAGLKTKMPFFQKVEKILMRAIKIDYNIPVDLQGAITRDNQTMGATLSIFYRYKKESLVEMWKNYGERKIEELITANLQEVFKAIIGQYNIFELPLNQEEIRSKCLLGIKDKLAVHPVEIVDLKITNYDWSNEFDKQIAATMQKAQEVKQKEQELKVTELESQKQVKLAESQKQALITEAEGKKEAVRLEAEAKVLQGEAIKKYNLAIAANIGIEIQLKKLEIEKIKAEKWNGQYVPTNNYAPIPFMQGAIQGQ